MYRSYCQFLTVLSFVACMDAAHAQSDSMGKQHSTKQALGKVSTGCKPSVVGRCKEKSKISTPSEITSKTLLLNKKSAAPTTKASKNLPSETTDKKVETYSSGYIRGTQMPANKYGYARNNVGDFNRGRTIRSNFKAE